MRIIDSALSILAPYECLGCSAEGYLLCGPCRHGLPPAPELCYRCQRPSKGAYACADCRAFTRLSYVRAGTVYAGVAKELVLRLKFSGAKRAARDMAKRVSGLMEGQSTGTVIVPVPTAAGRVRARGYDQAGLLARELSRQTRLTYLDCLVRVGHARQVGADRQRRLHQLEGVFRARSDRLPARHVILIDDVTTTGATLESAASALGNHVSGRISAVVFAQA